MDSLFSAFINQNNNRVLKSLAALFIFIGVAFLSQNMLYPWGDHSLSHRIVYSQIYVGYIISSVIYLIISSFVKKRHKSLLFDRLLNLALINSYLLLMLVQNSLDLRYGLDLIPFITGVIMVAVLFRETKSVHTAMLMYPGVCLICFGYFSGLVSIDLYQLFFLVVVFTVVAIFVAFLLHNTLVERFKILSELNDRNWELDYLNGTLKNYKRVMERDLGFAEKIQQVFLSSKHERIDEWQIDYIYLPKNGVSGDFYDFYQKEGRLCGVSLFDVTGHGVASSLVTMLAKQILSRLFRMDFGKSIADIAGNFNQEMINEVGDSHIYMAGVILKIEGSAVEYINAGHADIIVKRQDGSVETIIEGFAHRNPFFCLPEFDREYEVQNFTIQSGDTLFLSTDGLYEVASKNSKHPLSFLMLCEKIKTLPADINSQEMLIQLMDYIYSMSGRNDFDDDVTVLVLKKV